VLGVSFDSVEANERFATKFSFPYPLLCDTDRSIGIAYGAASNASDEYARRIAYVIDEKGKIAEAHEKVDAKSYPAEQLTRM
jgi:thioredoxin-dependent peroxiredoxin